MTTIVTKSGARKELPEDLERERVVGLDEECRIVVNDFDAFNREPELRTYAGGLKVLERPFLFGLTLCCNASDKGMEDGIGCRGCYGLEGELAVSRDGRKVIADVGNYLYKADDGTFPGLDPLDRFEDDARAEVVAYAGFCHCKPPKLDENDRCERCGTQWKKESK